MIAEDGKLYLYYDLDGIINVYKEKSWTSFDVTKKLRAILHEKKIGHTGTLDPMAEGVLVICAGTATKLVSSIEATEKVYEAEMKLGITTDTEDTTGTILEKRAVTVTADDVRRADFDFQRKSTVFPAVSAVCGCHRYTASSGAMSLQHGIRLGLEDACD